MSLKDAAGSGMIRDLFGTDGGAGASVETVEASTVATLVNVSTRGARDAEGNEHMLYFFELTFSRPNRRRSARTVDVLGCQPQDITISPLRCTSLDWEGGTAVLTSDTAVGGLDAGLDELLIWRCPAGLSHTELRDAVQQWKKEDPSSIT